ncbi:DUF2244 domain-containing protein [Roseovarius sp. SCSIO 43702]|uniref:DUF2244 domain-containing protein n=1 Tax=Roseovarius sp. SCSIO 43702 TaxID=2823043 RepID=UPI001C730EA8|nr:DUF2244 domain-containing protein [Roseovarius sp. SCSIO 43702]QYX57628.1 DUF2244 domain-containing protein [Roseovarius sp. SCSIO 43702]
MPYEWTSERGEAPGRRLVLWPHRSLPRKGFAAFILVTSAMLTVPLLPLLGSLALWGLLPFLVIAVMAVWWALQHSYRTGEMREALSIGPETVSLRRIEPDGRERVWDCNSHWAQACLYPSEGPVPHYITLRGEGREVELGAFLSEEERKALFPELQTALSRARRGGPG